MSRVGVSSSWFCALYYHGVSVLIGYFTANDESSHANETIAIVSQDQGLKGIA